MIQSGFQGLTEGKQAGYESEREAESGEEARATDLFDGKLQRCLEGMRRLTALELNTTWPLSYFGHSRRLDLDTPPVNNIYLFRKKSPFLSFLCSHPPTSLLLSTETVSRS